MLSLLNIKIQTILGSIAICLLVVGIIILIAIIKDRRENKNKDKTDYDNIVKQITKARENKQVIYQKKRLLTEAEVEFYNKLLKATNNKNVIVQPQVNLASIIYKDSSDKFQTELFRNIDFGIFDQEYNLILLVEYNDNTHLQKERQARDIKVKQICEAAGIPIITFWTNYENEISYIEKRIQEYIKKAA